MTINSSIDQEELKKFSKISDQWWDLEGGFKILHEINPLRLKFISDKIKQHFNSQDSDKPLVDLNILDIGCGGGLITAPLYMLGGNVTGVDPSAENINVAKAYANKRDLKINYVNSTPEELSNQAGEFDVILCLEVIEHVVDPHYFIKSFANLLHPGGMLIISTINRTIKSYFLAILMAEYILNWVPKKTHDYNKFLKPSEINSILNNNQLSLRELTGLVFNLSNQNWQLSQDIDVNYFAYAIKA
jgi:2-polyprenyl-6-hydroxyphenyl methylase/3-demethylubiquinone-9 3-methyltransferase